MVILDIWKIVHINKIKLFFVENFGDEDENSCWSEDWKQKLHLIAVSE